MPADVIHAGRCPRIRQHDDADAGLWIESDEGSISACAAVMPLVQCAHHILGHYGKDSALRQWGLAKSEGGKKATLRAIVAVARKLSVLLHRLWASGEYYKPFPTMS